MMHLFSLWASLDWLIALDEYRLDKVESLRYSMRCCMKFVNGVNGFVISAADLMACAASREKISVKISENLHKSMMRGK